MTVRAADRNSLVGNAGVNYVAWQLSRRGWHVLQTVRNIRGSGLYATDVDGTVFFGVQSKASAEQHPIALGTNLDDLRSEWWIITTHANSDHPICYVLKINDVRRLAKQDRNGGKWWLDHREYGQDAFREAWNRIGEAGGRHTDVAALQDSPPPSGSKKVRVKREEMNGVKRPGAGGKCAAVWDYLDLSPAATAKDMRELATSVGWNMNNTLIEYYQWRKFHGLTRTKAKEVEAANGE